MRGRRLLLVSLAANFALAAGCYFFWHAGQRAKVSAEIKVKEVSTNTPTRTKLLPVYRKQFFSWSEIESEDYEQYIKNLRDIGCPEQTIRDIIVADVNGLFLKKRLEQIVTTNGIKEWWREDFNPRGGLDQADLKRIRALADEQNHLLTRLLGTGWRASDKTFASLALIRFDGRVLEAVSDEKRQEVYAIMGRAEAERIGDWTSGAQSELKARSELARVLNPPQLEEFLLRYSMNSESLRGLLREIQYFQITAEEFRAVFKATDQMDMQMRTSSVPVSVDLQMRNPSVPVGAATENTVVWHTVRAWLQQRDAAIKDVLTAERYAEYVRLQDPAFREALTATLALGGKAELVKTLYSVNQEVAAERSRIYANTNLSYMQRELELKKVELTQVLAQAQATGQLPVEEVVAQPMPESPPMPPTPPSVYFLRRGEGLSDVANKFGISLSALHAANPGVILENLRMGDKIMIPAAYLVPVGQ